MTEADVDDYILRSAPLIEAGLKKRGFTTEVARTIALDAAMSYASIRFGGEDGETVHIFGFDFRLADEALVKDCVSRVVHLFINDEGVVIKCACSS